MKTNDARYILGCFPVVRDVVSGHPIFVAPDVTQQNKHEACEIKNEFFDWNRPAQCRNFAAKSGRVVWKSEERVAEKEIQRESEWSEHPDSPPKCFSWKFEIRPTGKPPSQGSDRDNEQSQAPG